MNCQEFEDNLDGLARGALADSRLRAEAEAHEETCAACAARLADERALTRGLRALASGMGGEEAPARVEAALLAAFRARVAFEDESSAVTTPAVSSPAVSPCAVPAQNVLSLPRRANVKGWSWSKTLAVASLAAAAAVALFLLAPQFVSAPARKSNALAGTQTDRRQQDNATQDADYDANKTATPDDLQLASSRDGDAGRESSLPGRVEVVAPRAGSQHRSPTTARATDVGYVEGGSRGASAAAGENAGGQGGAEVATDFIPLVQAAHFGQAEGGHVVRVEMPRSALASFGLPVNFERAGGRVKADVLFGDDGIARAIRFVR